MLVQKAGGQLRGREMFDENLIGWLCIRSAGV